MGERSHPQTIFCNNWVSDVDISIAAINVYSIVDTLTKTDVEFVELLEQWQKKLDKLTTESREVLTELAAIKKIVDYQDHILKATPETDSAAVYNDELTDDISDSEGQFAASYIDYQVNSSSRERYIRWEKYVSIVMYVEIVVLVILGMLYGLYGKVDSV
jgi:hypothetical protein